MTKLPNKHGTKGSSNEWHADVPQNVKPYIAREYRYKGVRMYLGFGGKHYIADIFDKMFNCAVVIPMRHCRYKGESPGKKAI